MHLAGALFAAQKRKTTHQAMEGTNASVLNRGSCCQEFEHQDDTSASVLKRGSCCQEFEHQDRSASPIVTESSKICNTEPSAAQTNPDDTATQQPAIDSTETSFADQELSDELEPSKSCPRCPASFRASEEPFYNAFPVRPLVVTSKRGTKYNASETLDDPATSSPKPTLLADEHDEDEDGGLMAPKLVVPTTTPVESVGPPLGRTSSAPSQMR